MFLSFILLALENLTITDAFYVLLSLATALFVWKSGLLQQLFTSSNQLLTVRTTERDDALRERDLWKSKYTELDNDYRVLRKELTQRVELTLQDQEELRELRKLLKGIK